MSKLTKTARKVIIAAVKPFPPLRRLARDTINGRRGRIYQQIRRSVNVEPKTVIFESFMGRSYSDNPRAIYEAMLRDKRMADYRFIWAFKPDKLAELSDLLPDKQRTSIIAYGTADYYRAYAQAGIWVSNSRLPEYLQPTKAQKYIQTWHGTPLKRLGYDIEVVGENAMNTKRDICQKYDDDSKRYTAMISPSPFVTACYKSAFDLDKNNPKCQICQVGYPRNDILSTYTKTYVARLKKQYGIPHNKKVILYAPTWRDNQHKAGLGYTYQNELDFDELQRQLSDDYVILFRAHYFVANQFNFAKYDGFVIDTSNTNDVNDLYLISDMLITDYSSVFFDYAILKRPIIFYMYDLDEYQNRTRGFYIPLAKLPGPITQNIDELINAIKQPFKLSKKYQDFVNKYAPLDDGQAGKRVVDEVLELSLPRKYGRPMVSILRPRLRVDNNFAIVTGRCILKVAGVNMVHPDDFYVTIDDKKYVLNLSFIGRLRCRGYCLGNFNLRMPIDSLLTSDIQNKVILHYCNDSIDKSNRIRYRLWDRSRGHYRHSKISVVNNDTAIYLRQTIANSLYITVRPYNYLDTFKGQCKIFFAWLLSKLPIKRKIILLYEKECERYQESASVLYERLRSDGYDNAYYVIDTDLPAYQKIPQQFRDNVIAKHSFRHLLYFFCARTFIGTETIGHSIQLRCANRLALAKERSKKLTYVFLQHGVMYMVSLNSNMRSGFRNQYGYRKYRVVVSSNLEKKHFIDLGGFDNDELYVTGLPKFDRAYRNKGADWIVIMPTWRRWETNQAKEDYRQTEYYQLMRRIAKAVPADLQNKVILLPHPLMADQLRNEPANAKYLPPEGLSYDEVLRNCKLLITDYSSIAYDAFYRGSNVIFDWSEKDDCMEHYGGGTFLMLNDGNAFGDIVYSENKKLTKLIEQNYYRDQAMDYVDQYRRIVKYHDGKNTDRLMECMQEDKII